MQVHGLSEKSSSRPCVMGSALDSGFIKDMSGSVTIPQTFQRKGRNLSVERRGALLEKIFRP
jgi:hypothetical protein